MAARTVRERFAHAFFDRGNELPRHDAADDLVFERDARAALARLEAQPHVAELPVAAGLMLVARMNLGAEPVIVSRYGIDGGAVSTSTLYLRARRSTAIETCCSPLPSSRSSWVTSARCRRSAGSSSTMRASICEIFASSMRSFGLIATAKTGSATGTRGQQHFVAVGRERVAGRDRFEARRSRRSSRARPR